MARDWSQHFDSYGLLTHNGDGGDTASREGLFAIAEVLLPIAPARELSWEFRVSKLEIDPGIFVRHPEHSRAVPSFWSNPNEFSRDQQNPLSKAMVFKNRKHVFDRLFKNHSRRFFFCQNKDFFGPAIYIRAYGWYWLYPLLVIMDLALLWNSLNRIGLIPRIQETTGKVMWLNEDDVGDDINHTVDLLYSRFRMPTPVSYLARILYRSFRPYGGCQRAWDHYFREEVGAPPLNEMWAPIIQKWIMS